MLIASKATPKATRSAILGSVFTLLLANYGAMLASNSNFGCTAFRQLSLSRTPAAFVNHTVALRTEIEIRFPLHRLAGANSNCL